MQLRVSAHMSLIDDRPIPRHQRLGGLLPVVIRIHHHALRHEGRAVTLIEGEVIAFCSDGVAETCVIPLELTDELSCIWIEQQFIWIEAVTVLGLIGTVNPQPVHLTWADS